MDGIVLKQSWAGEVRNLSVLIVIGVNQDGLRGILGRIMYNQIETDKKMSERFLTLPKKFGDN